jgi:hypothetical protein
MDCDQVAEILDAYSLGASEPEEARGLEEHVSDCVRCWESLNKAQQASAMLALAVPLESAPAGLEELIMSKAASDALPSLSAPPRGLFDRLRFGWPAAAGAFGVAGVVALVFAALVQVQLSDLRGENDDLEAMVAAGEETVDGMQEIMTVFLRADDLQTRPFDVRADQGADSSVTYSWSQELQKGFILCDSLPSLPAGQTYQAWFATDGSTQSAGQFASRDGSCSLPLGLDGTTRPPGVGITIEPEGGTGTPEHEEFILYTPVSN